MILGYQDRRTAAFASGKRLREFTGFDRQAWRRLDVLDAATTLADRRALPSNRLEAVKGARAGQLSIGINGQWRICSIWPAGDPGPSEVEIVDYH